VCSVVLLVATLLALFAYVIVPDETKDANRQVPAMALQFPGTHQQYALIERLSAQKPLVSYMRLAKNYQLRHYDTGQVRIPMVEMCLVD